MLNVQQEQKQPKSLQKMLSLGGREIGYWYAICNLLTIC